MTYDFWSEYVLKAELFLGKRFSPVYKALSGWVRLRRDGILDLRFQLSDGSGSKNVGERELVRYFGGGRKDMEQDSLSARFGRV